ncbi:polysaccharide deacetylase family protein [Paenibacillus sp. 32352]|uniref:polysaccharide deacetylase family protein n=1 Tax=Paenibacillus sp. 32352 TaxID=1969111 RepID=UPI0009AC90E8|nr:polysaccharide deacetylase family protein [Paenibacillus sp. 32352]
MRSLSFLWKTGLAIGIASLLLLFSIYQWGSYSYTQQVAVLAYHHLSHDEQSNVTITPQLFREQLSFLRQKGYHFITLDQFKQFIEGGSVPNKAVLVTFDDGYESFYTYGYPILKELGIPAVNFVVTKDLHHPKRPHLPSLSQEEIRTMALETKDIDFQCHSHDMHAKMNGRPHLTSLLHREGAAETPEEYRQRVLKDTNACIRNLYELHSEPVDSYAYPFGMYHQEATDLIRQAGIKYAFTVASHMAIRADDPMQIPRINAGNPSITPESLHQTIMRRAIARKLPVTRL